MVSPCDAMVSPCDAMVSPCDAMVSPCDAIFLSLSIISVSRFSMAEKNSSSTFMSCRSLVSEAAVSRRCRMCIISVSPSYLFSSIRSTWWLYLFFILWSKKLSTSSSLLFTWPLSRGICTIMLSWVRLSTNGSGMPLETRLPS